MTPNQAKQVAIFIHALRSKAERLQYMAQYRATASPADLALVKTAYWQLPIHPPCQPVKPMPALSMLLSQEENDVCQP